jgi:hypothetical protein
VDAPAIEIIARHGFAKGFTQAIIAIRSENSPSRSNP